jgi:hypothetical protein
MKEITENQLRIYESHDWFAPIQRKASVVHEYFQTEYIKSKTIFSELGKTVYLAIEPNQKDVGFARYKDNGKSFTLLSPLSTRSDGLVWASMGFFEQRDLRKQLLLLR